jgi:hypothetical protein
MLYLVDQGNGAKCFLELSWGTAENASASTKAGRPIVDKVLMGKVFAPGQAKSEVIYEFEREFSDGSTRKRDDLIHRFQEQYNKFMANEEVPEDLGGTPLAEWTALGVKQVAELNLMNIPTVEALAECSDAALQELGIGARDLRSRAQAYLAAAMDVGKIDELATENVKLQEQINELQKQISALAGGEQIDIEDVAGKPRKGKK